MLVWCSPGRRAGLGVESAEVVRAVAILRMHHFERHVAAERLANGFVNHAHAAFAQVAEDPVVAQLLGDLVASGRQRPANDPSSSWRAGLNCSTSASAGNRSRMSSAMFGVTLDVLGERRMLAAAKPIGELLGQQLEGIAVGGRFAHGSSLALLEFTEVVGRHPSRHQVRASGPGSP